MEEIKQLLFRDMVLIDARVLLILVPVAMLLMRAIINQSFECVVYLVVIGVLSVLWVISRQKNYFNNQSEEAL